jgi:hypothetical protein
MLNDVANFQETVIASVKEYSTSSSFNGLSHHFIRNSVESSFFHNAAIDLQSKTKTCEVRIA